MIVFEDVTKDYKGGNHALKHVNLRIRKGDFVFVLGHSGAGKSTFIKLILREEQVTSGRVLVDGLDLSTMKKRKVPYLRRRMGVVFQDFRLIPTMSVYENVAFAMRVTNIAEDKIKKRVPYVLGLVGLADKADRLPDEISGGEQQRVALARALVHSPQLIIADEPTGNIDPKLSVEMMELLKAINSVGITVVVVTHEVALAKRFGKRIITLDHGVVASDTAPAPMEDDMETTLRNIREKLIAGVEKRLDADAPVGFLLSGGLDSSLVCSIAAKKLGKPIRTFAIGMDTDAIDLKYARQTADYLGSEHHEIIINRDMVIQSLEEVIRLLGTWDITTIRASMGMYLLCKAIHEQTDVRVLLTGEISDELFGYKYTDYAPTADAFQQESQKRIRELYMYDVLRADRCISANSIEARVPFGDLDFVRYVMAIDPEKKLNSYGKGKYLLRKAFEGDWLPPEILWREKAAFSDAVGHSMVDDIKEYAESLYTDEEFQLRRANYSAHCMPFTKESLFYREIFEKYYHDQSRTIVGFWMPNKAWPGCNVNDPSARVLANYGASGV